VSRKEEVLKCYICDQEGRETEAVAICIVCGIAVCKEHQVRHEIALTETFKWGTTEEVITLPTPLPRILCAWCYQALVMKRRK
jgi:hypothetical protein